MTATRSAFAWAPKASNASSTSIGEEVLQAAPPQRVSEPQPRLPILNTLAPEGVEGSPLKASLSRRHKRAAACRHRRSSVKTGASCNVVGASLPPLSGSKTQRDTATSYKHAESGDVVARLFITTYIPPTIPSSSLRAGSMSIDPSIRLPVGLR